MISHAHDFTVRLRTVKSPNLLRAKRLDFALLAIAVFGGWFAVWFLIVGFGFALALLLGCGLVVFPLCPARRLDDDSRGHHIRSRLLFSQRIAVRHSGLGHRFSTLGPMR